MSEVKCSDCGNPDTKDTQATTNSTSKINGTINTTIYVKDLGEIPVLQGDPKWLPKKVQKFIVEKIALMRPANVFICNGSVFEKEMLIKVLIEQGCLEKLSAYEDVYNIRTDPLDTARVEKHTFICTAKKEVVEATRTSTKPCELAQHISRSRCRSEIEARFPGCMRGRTMFVVPFSMGPIGGQYSYNAVELTDCPFVVLNMRVVSRVSSSVWDAIGVSDFIKCVHSMGSPRPLTRKTAAGWPCNPDRIFITHYLPEDEVWSFGSGYGGNSLLGKKSLALRIASYKGWKDGWLAEHAAILSITDPNGRETFICVSFPSGAGKTVMATMIPALEGWKVRVISDDIAWLRWSSDGQLYASAPENGMFGIAAETKPDTGANIIKMVSRNSLLVNAATTSKGKFFWNGLEKTLDADETVTDWRGKAWKLDDKSPAAHANCRFTTYTTDAPNVHPKWDCSKGVPISAYIFGMRRPDEFPLVMESRRWAEGVTLAAANRTQAGSASEKKSESLIHDPMSMRPFLSYNFANYVRHWLSMDQGTRKMPKIFHVNWYQQRDGKPIWPGYGENIRVLEWILNRVHSSAETVTIETPIGLIPKELNMKGLDGVDLASLLKVEKNFWTEEVKEMSEYFAGEMGSEQPEALQKIIAKFTQELTKQK